MMLKILLAYWLMGQTKNMDFKHLWDSANFFKEVSITLKEKAREWSMHGSGQCTAC